MECKGEEVKIDIDQEGFNLSNTRIEREKRKQMEIDIKERLKPASGCCIYRVPTSLRKIKEEAYTPQFISIGPLHYGKPQLANMEKQKIRYKEDFGERLKRVGQEWQVLIDFIEEKEQDIRDCYEETSHLRRSEFITMVLYDAIFIIELFLKSHEKAKDDYLLFNALLGFGIGLDLQLIENQLPFFVLNELHKLACHSLSLTPFLTLSCNYFRLTCTEECDHFVDLHRKALVKDLPDGATSSSDVEICDLPSAVKLHESGVKFKKRKDDCSWLQIKFEKGSYMPCFTGDELQIPPIPIDDRAEVLFRNMMALELCHYPSQTHICNYVYLMDCLINSEKDVDLLVEKGIISNLVGDHVAIAEMFNKLCLQIVPSGESFYKDIVKALIKHYRRPWNRTKATLISVYFSNLWRGTGTVAATILLVLTFVQTIYSMWRIMRGLG